MKDFFSFANRVFSHEFFRLVCLKDWNNIPHIVCRRRLLPSIQYGYTPVPVPLLNWWDQSTELIQNSINHISHINLQHVVKSIRQSGKKSDHYRYLLAACIKGNWATRWSCISDCRVDRGRGGTICHITIWYTIIPHCAFPGELGWSCVTAAKWPPRYLDCGNRTLERFKLHSSCHPLIVQRYVVIQCVFFIVETAHLLT